MTTLTPLKRTQPAPDDHAIRGIKPRRESKALASRAPRQHKNQPRKAATPTVEQLIQEILFLRSQVAALITENEAMKALLPVAHKQAPLPVMRLKPPSKDKRTRIIKFASTEKKELDARVADKNDDLEAIA